MSFHIVNPLGRRPGRPRNQVTLLLALEYLLWPGKKPNGLQKALAHANGASPKAVNAAVTTIQQRATVRPRRQG